MLHHGTYHRETQARGIGEIYKADLVDGWKPASEAELKPEVLSGYKVRRYVCAGDLQSRCSGTRHTQYFMRINGQLLLLL